jgi:iron complex transport system ATP-binding protein
VVAVLHDLNQACRYASHLLVMRAGRLVAAGAPGDVLTAELVRDVFDLSCEVIPDPVTGTPLVVPHDRRTRRPAAAAADPAGEPPTAEPADPASGPSTTARPDRAGASTP